MNREDIQFSTVMVLTIIWIGVGGFLLGSNEDSSGVLSFYIISSILILKGNSDSYRFRKREKAYDTNPQAFQKL